MGFESRDYARDGSYTASLSAWGMDLTPVVKYLVIANVVVFLLQVLLTRPAAPQLPDFDVISPDQEETAAEAEPPARKKDAASADERRKREQNARKAREAMEEMMTRMPGMRTSTDSGMVRAQPEENRRARADLAAGDERILPRPLRTLAHLV